MHPRTIEVFPFPALDGKNVCIEMVVWLTTTGNLEEAATCICLGNRIPHLPQSVTRLAHKLSVNQRSAQTRHMCKPPFPNRRCISNHAPVFAVWWKSTLIRGLNPVMHVDLIMIKTLSSQLQREKLLPHATTDLKYVGSTFLIGLPCQMAEYQGSLLNFCQQLHCWLSIWTEHAGNCSTRSLWIIIRGG